MKIGILTGGGDVPGLNPCIKAIVHRVIDAGHEVVGIRRGWGGLLWLNPDDPESVDKNIFSLDKHFVRTIDRSGGTVLHTSRTDPSNLRAEDTPDFMSAADYPGNNSQDAGVYDFTPHILSNLEFLGIDALIPIGGDGTLTYTERMCREGFPIVAIPKTMDNDVYGTDYCIGFSTAVSRSVQFIHQLRTTAGSHERVVVVELFGRYSGETCLISSYLADADRALISEVPFDLERLAELVLQDKRANPSKYAMVAVSEGARMSGDGVVTHGETDIYGNRKLGGIGAVTCAALKDLTGEEVIVQQLSYLMRSGTPDALDRMVAVNYAHIATHLILAGTTGRMVALRDGVYTHVPMSTITKGTKRVDVEELYDLDSYRPKVRHVLSKPMFLY